MMSQSADLDTALEEMNHAKDSFFHNHQQRMDLLEKALNKSTEQIQHNDEEIRKNSEIIERKLAEMKAKLSRI